MKYKEFIAKAAIQIMAHQCESFREDMFTKTDKGGNVLGPSIDLEDAAMNSVVAAKTLAAELENDFVYEKKDFETNHKMHDDENFFDEYERD